MEIARQEILKVNCDAYVKQDDVSLEWKLLQGTIHDSVLGGHLNV